MALKLACAWVQMNSMRNSPLKLELRGTENQQAGKRPPHRPRRFKLVLCQDSELGSVVVDEATSPSVFAYGAFGTRNLVHYDGSQL